LNLDTLSATNAGELRRLTGVCRATTASIGDRAQCSGDVMTSGEAYVEAVEAIYACGIGEATCPTR